MLTDASSCSSHSMAESYIGCFISLTSNYDIRYEGVLHFLDLQDSTIVLKNVRSYGTEGRRKDGLQLPHTHQTYDFILFRGNDIKNLEVKSPSTSLKAEEQVLDDTAIIQQQYSETISSPAPSVCSRSLTESVQRHDTPAITSRAVPVELSSHRSVPQLGPSFSSPLNQSAATRVASPQSFSTTVTWHGNNGASTSSSDSLNSPALLSTKPPMPYSASTTSNGSNMSSFSSPFGDINSVDGQMFAKISPNPVLSHPGHFIRHHASSLVDFTSVPSPASKALLRPLSNSVVFQKPLCPGLEFMEEFDFEAMNEKFKKDEVWGSLGRETEKVEDNDPYNLIPNPKPAYNKDEFFDSISGNSMIRGLRNEQN